MIGVSNLANVGLQPRLRCIQPVICGFHSGLQPVFMGMEYPDLGGQDPDYLKKHCSQSLGVTDPNNKDIALFGAAALLT